MATPTFAIQRLLRSVRRIDPDHRRINRARYEAILRAVFELTDESTHDDLVGWIVVETVHDGDLPSPERLRRRARLIVEHQNADIPEHSPFRRT